MVALDYDYESVFPDQIMNCYKKRIQYLQKSCRQFSSCSKISEKNILYLKYIILYVSILLNKIF